MAEVTGSNPVSPTNKINRLRVILEFIGICFRKLDDGSDRPQCDSAPVLQYRASSSEKTRGDIDGSVIKIWRQILIQGRSIRSVSQQTGLSRNTIRKYFKDESPPSYQLSQPVSAYKLKGYEDQRVVTCEFDLKRPHARTPHSPEAVRTTITARL